MRDKEGEREREREREREKERERGGNIDSSILNRKLYSYTTAR